MKITRHIVVLCCAGITLLTLCKVATEPTTQTRTVKSLKIAVSEITPWAEDADGYKEFSNVNELYVIMNGGADDYYNRNAIEGFFQYMSNVINASTTYSAECRVLDFGTAANATVMYNYKTENISNKQAVGALPLTTAAIDPDGSLYGVNAYAIFGQYYFEIAFDGYGSNKTEAAKNAGSYIQVFQQKVKSM